MNRGKQIQLSRKDAKIAQRKSFKSALRFLRGLASSRDYLLKNFVKIIKLLAVTEQSLAQSRQGAKKFEAINFSLKNSVLHLSVMKILNHSQFQCLFRSASTVSMH